jgi:5S rRNA maturation endonuclease (ribonuclease M5)
VVEGNDDEKSLQKLLLDTMNTLKPSDKPLSLDKASEMVKGN